VNLKPTEILEAEHKFIQIVISALAEIAGRMEAGREIPKEILFNVVDFMRSYADADHHGKEEAILFPFLEKKGVPPQGCPLSILISEHQRGRSLVSDLAESAEKYSNNEPGAKEKLLKTFHTLVDLYPKHIWREDYLLFPMTDKLLSADEQDYIRQQFEAAEKKFGEENHLKFEQMAQEIKNIAEKD